MGKIGLDLDGVVTNYTKALIALINLMEQENYRPSDVTTWNLTNLGYDEETIDALTDYMTQQKTFEYLEPIKGSINGIRHLNNQGHTIHIITSREGDARYQGVKWLEDHLVNYESISFTKKKGETAKLLGLDYLIDDHIRYVIQAGMKGIRGLLFNTTWNKKYVLPPKGIIKRVYGWNGVAKHLNT